VPFAAPGPEFSLVSHCCPLVEEFSSTASSDDSTLLAAVNGGREVDVFDGFTGRLIRALRHPAEDRKPYSRLVAGLRPDGQVIASARGSVTRLWDPRTGQQKAYFALPSGDVEEFAFSRDSRLLVARSSEAVQLADASSGKVLALLRMPDELSGDTFHSAQPSPDGRWIASLVSGGLLLWNVASGRLTRALPSIEAIRTADDAEGEPFDAASFSPDGSTIATSGGRVQLWEVSTGKLLAHFESNSETPDVHFTPSGTQIMIVDGNSHGTSVHLHRFRPADLISNACALLPFDLAQEFWKTYIPGEPYRQICTPVKK